MFCLLFYNPPIRDILLLLFKAGKGIESAAENGFNPYATRILRFVAIIPSGHTYVVASIMAGDDVKTIQQNAGHYSSAFTLDRYAHVTTTMQRESASRMEKFIAAL